MTAVLALLNYIVGVLLSLLGITQSRADQITVNKILAILTDPVVGLNALHGELTTVLADLASIQGDVLALGAPQQTGSPVTLPTTPPSGYGGASASDAATAVWTYTDFRGLFTPFTIMYALYNYFNGQRQTWAMDVPSSRYFRVSTDILSRPVVTWPVLAPSGPDTILSTDTDIGVWLNRTQAPLTWIFLTGQQVWQATYAGPPNVYIQCTMSDAEFRWFQAINAGARVVPIVPPVWPGLANITYGTTVSMDAPGGQLDGPADGYKIVIDAVPSWAGTFSFGPRTSFRNVGAIAFLNDEGEPEFPQTLGFDVVIYCPKDMTTSAGAVYRLNVGYHCTATPFTIN